MTIGIWISVVGWVLGWVVFGRLRGLGDGAVPDRPGPMPSVTVVIPARDEELSLPRLLDDLARSRPPGCRVVVVDDHSRDRTAAVAASHPFVEVVAAPDLPAGWTGKCWACHTGSLTASPEDLLVFLDADVRLRPGALDRLVAAAADSDGLVSVQPWHDTERPYEQLSSVFNVVAVMGTGAGGPGPSSGAFGPVLATRASAYRRVGGHEAVRDQVVEDVALADRYRAAGEAVRIVAGGDAVRFRMFPAGIRQLVEGWTKNFATGAGSTRAVRLLAVVTWVAASGSAVGVLVDAAGGAVTWWAALAIYGGFVVQFLVMFRQVGRFGAVTAVVYPVLVAFFLAVFARSAWRTYVRRSVEWRGRVIPVGAARG